MTRATVLAGPERRRRWTRAEKLRLVEESLTAGLSVAEFARQRDIHPNLIHAWRREARTGALSAGRSEPKVRFAPVAIASVATPVTVLSCLYGRAAVSGNQHMSSAAAGYAALAIGGKVVLNARISANRSVRTVFRKARQP